MTLTRKKATFTPSSQYRVSGIIPDFDYCDMAGGRGEGGYILKRPNVFVGTASEGVLQPGDKIVAVNNQPTDGMTHLEAQNIFKTVGTSAKVDVARMGPASPGFASPMGGGTLDDDKVHSQAKSVLTQRLSCLVPRAAGVASEGAGHTHEEQTIHEQAYRTTPLVLPHAKTIHDAVDPNKYIKVAKDTPPGQPYRSSAPLIHHGKSIHEVVDTNKFIPVAKETPGESKPYRTCPLVMPAPKTINEVGAGAPTYQPPRGPQYRSGSFGTQPMERQIFGAGLKSAQAPCSYNTAINLYSDDNLAAAVATQDGLHPGFVPPSKPTLPSSKDATFSKPQESETFKLVLESEMGSAKNEDGVVGKDFSKSGGPDRPASQQSDHTRTIDPLMKNTSINQSASFKKVMYSVLGETEF